MWKQIKFKQKQKKIWTLVKRVEKARKRQFSNLQLSYCRLFRLLQCAGVTLGGVAKLPNKLTMCDYSKLICANKAKVTGVNAATTATTSNSDEIMSFILRLALKFIKKVPFETCNSSVCVMDFSFVCCCYLSCSFSHSLSFPSLSLTRSLPILLSVLNHTEESWCVELSRTSFFFFVCYF